MYYNQLTRSRIIIIYYTSSHVLLRVSVALGQWRMSYQSWNWRVKIMLVKHLALQSVLTQPGKKYGFINLLKGANVVVSINTGSILDYVVKTKHWQKWKSTHFFWSVEIFLKIFDNFCHFVSQSSLIFCRS